MKAGVVFDEEEEIAYVPFLTEQNTDVPPAIHHQKGREETGWWGLNGPHRQLEMERILRGDCIRGTDEWERDLGKGQEDECSM